MNTVCRWLWSVEYASWNFTLIYKTCFEHLNAKYLLFIIHAGEIKKIRNLEVFKNCLCIFLYAHKEIKYTILHPCIGIIEVLHCPPHVGKCFIIHARCMICLFDFLMSWFLNTLTDSSENSFLSVSFLNSF